MICYSLVASKGTLVIPGVGQRLTRGLPIATPGPGCSMSAGRCGRADHTQACCLDEDVVTTAAQATTALIPS